MFIQVNGNLKVACLEHSYILDLSAVCLSHKTVAPEFQGKQNPVMGGVKETPV